MCDPDSGKTLIHDLSREETKAVCEDHGLPSYRADQLWQWLYRHRVTTWDAMKNLPAQLREKLAHEFELVPARQVEIVGEEGGTRKILVRLSDGECVEAVVLPAAPRRTVCISCQVGCKFACAFCASGQGGYLRNLTAGEMIGQVLLAADIYQDNPTHVVFMGMGEPFDNYDSVLKAVRLLNDSNGLNIGARRITMSTCGIIPGIQRLQGEGLQVELSVSLHAATQPLREELIPAAKRYPLRELLAVCKDYAEATKRIITFEYTLIRNVNDALEQAKVLTSVLKPIPCRVNLIPLSPVTEFDGEPSSRNRAFAFMEILAAAGINATVRDSQGSDLQAACGQLRLQRKAFK